MLKTREGLLSLFVLVLLCTSVFGAFAGYSVGGVDYSMSTDEPELLTIVDWAWDSMTFLFNIATMQVDNVPFWVSAIFQFMSIMTIYLIVTIVRGN